MSWATGLEKFKEMLQIDYALFWASIFRKHFKAHSGGKSNKLIAILHYFEQLVSDSIWKRTGPVPQGKKLKQMQIMLLCIIVSKLF